MNFANLKISRRMHNLKEIGKNFLVVESELAKAVGKGVYKKNTASRLISRLSKKIRSAS